MPTLDSPAVEIMYIGGPTTVISIAGLNMITDPTFDAAGTDYKVGKISQHKTKAPAVSTDALPRLDVALVSHDQHYDNLDNAGRELLGSIPLVFTTRDGAARLGKNVVGMAPWQERTIKASDGITLKITATPARHGPVGVEELTGDVVGFVITAVESGEDLVYVTGDTVWYEGTSEVARRFDPRVVMLFAGAALTARGPFYLTMNTNDAIAAANAFASSTIVPVHHDGWAHLTQSQEQLSETFSTLGFATRLRTVQPGRTLTFSSRIEGPLGAIP